MDVLVQGAGGPMTVPMERFRHELSVGMAPMNIPVSLDGGQSWIPGWQAAGLSAPGSSDDALKMVVPIGRSGWAIVTGYLALFTMFIDLFLLAMVIGFTNRSADRRDPRELLTVIFVCFVMGAPAQIVTALLASRSMRKDPKLLGKGRVIYSWVCVSSLLLLCVAGIVVALVA
jgi:hypothetical protein